MVSAIPILFVEDEPLVMEAVALSLEDGGYGVVRAESGDAAIATLGRDINGLAAVITDVRLGQGPSGWDVARHARDLRHDIPILYITGDSGSDWPVFGVPKSVLLQKPFAPAQLLTALSTLLNEAGGAVG